MKPILIAKELKKYYIVGGFLSRKVVIKAVDGISFTLNDGETLGLVGESGSGKSTAGKTVIRLVEPTAGDIIFMDVNIAKLNDRELMRFRKYMQIVHQDPYSSLNPRMRILDNVGRPLKIHGLVSSTREYVEEVCKLLELVGLDNSFLYRYPHELSGGQRQRVAIARALASRPKLVVLDEPTSALDVSVQAQILNLLKGLQESLKISYIFISHDLAVVSYMSHRVAVMYAGKLVECGGSKELFKDPKHPYTLALINALPRAHPTKTKIKSIEGEPPDPSNPPPGCRFHPRCPYAMDLCRREEPPLKDLGSNHLVACWLY